MEDKYNLDFYQLYLINRIEDMNLNYNWKFIIQNMTTNYFYSVRKAIQDAIDYQIKIDNQAINDKTKEMQINFLLKIGELKLN